MNRREAIKSGLAVLAAAGVDGEVATISAKDPQAFVVRSSIRLTTEQAEHLMRVWHKTFIGTPLEDVPIIIFPECLTLEVIDNVN